MTWNEFVSAVESLGYSITDAQLGAFKKYLTFLQQENEKINLTAIIDEAGIIEKHFYDSLLLAPYLKENQNLLDIGSGAGFPGFPIAIMRPDLTVTLLEPTWKRARFLELVKEELGINNVLIANERAEDYVKVARESFTYATARAVANLAILSELSLPLVKVNGTMFALKAKESESEIELAENAIKTLGGTITSVNKFTLSGGEVRTIIEIKKVKPTPSKYPRHYGQIKKKPL